MKTYDLAIIGSGPGGYVAALYASRRGMSVCLIEKDQAGGTCLNRGCIPTKALLTTSSIVSTIQNSSNFGVEISGYKIDYAKAAARKDGVVFRLRTGLESLLSNAKVDFARGRGRLASAYTIAIEGSEDIKAKNIIIAVGSKVAGLPGIAIDEKNVLSSDGILAIKELPKNLLIIGGGVVGCEFATLFNALGVKVKIVEIMDRLVPSLSREISKKLEVILKKRGIEIALSSKADPASCGTEKVLVSVGRVPDTGSLGLEGLGIKTEKGRVVVDASLRTSVKNIYAIGDCVSGPQLAHKASYDGILACDNILGHARTVDYSNIPSCIWTDPEIGCVGMNEEESRAKHPDARIAKFQYSASGKAAVSGKTEGFIKIIGDANAKILGVEIFGHDACELIAEATLAKTVGISIKKWAESVHGHPTLSEISQEAAHIFCGTPIHSM